MCALVHQAILPNDQTTASCPAWTSGVLVLQVKRAIHGNPGPVRSWTSSQGMLMWLWGWLTIAPHSSGVWLPLICPSALGAPNPVPCPASQAQTNHRDAVIGPAGIMEGSQAWLETICTKVHVQARQGGEAASGQCPRQKTGRRKEAKRSAG